MHPLTIQNARGSNSDVEFVGKISSLQPHELQDIIYSPRQLDLKRVIRPPSVQQELKVRHGHLARGKLKDVICEARW
jgi:hypothetical protein